MDKAQIELPVGITALVAFCIIILIFIALSTLIYFTSQTGAETVKISDEKIDFIAKESLIKLLNKEVVYDNKNMDVWKVLSEMKIIDLTKDAKTPEVIFLEQELGSYLDQFIGKRWIRVVDAKTDNFEEFYPVSVRYQLVISSNGGYCEGFHEGISITNMNIPSFESPKKIQFCVTRYSNEKN